MRARDNGYSGASSPATLSNGYKASAKFHKSHKRASDVTHHVIRQPQTPTARRGSRQSIPYAVVDVDADVLCGVAQGVEVRGKVK